MHTHLHQITNWFEMAKEANWHTAELAQLCKVSTRTLERFFLKKFGKTPKAWMIEIRQQWAAARIRDGFWPKEVAVEMKYKSHSQFSREFKNYWGCSPGELAQQPALERKMS